MGTNSWRVAALRVRDYKKVRDVEITPASDSAIILIAGDNAQGKTSILEAFEVATRGKAAQLRDPVRHGAEEAGIWIELDDKTKRKLTIERTIDASTKANALKLLLDGTPVPRPQEFLNKILGSRFIDPLAFLRVPEAEQREHLLALIDKEGVIKKLEERREKIYDKRTEVGRDLHKAEGEVARLPLPVDVKPALVVATLAAERAQLAERRREVDAGAAQYREARTRAAQASEALARGRARAEDLEEKLRHLEAQLGQERAGIAALEISETAAIGEASRAAAAAQERGDAFAAVAPRLAEIDEELARADAWNKAIVEAEHNNRRRTEAEAVVKELAAQRDKQTAAIEKIDQQKSEFLQAADLPVPGLDFDEEGLMLGGAPFKQASSAEQLRVAFGIAIAASPQFDDIWVRDGALLDASNLQLIVEQAEAAGKRLWLERVSDRDPGAVVIVDGKVRE